MNDAYKPDNPKEETEIPLSHFFLKSIVAGLGIVLVAGFVCVVGVVILGTQYFVEKEKFEPYRLAKNITLTPMPVGEVVSASISPAGIEILYKTSDDKIMLAVYHNEDGNLKSEVTIKKK